MIDLGNIRRDYEQDPLRPEDMDMNPVLQFEKWMEEVARLYKDDANIMTLSTVSANGRPFSRIVLLKGMTDKSFVFYTNYESRKGKEILENSHVALLFYWPELDRQIRIEGVAGKVESGISDSYFEMRPAGSRKSAIVSPQSREIEDYSELETRWKALEDSESHNRPRHWGGYEVVPDYFEFWQGRPNRLHDRIAYILRSDSDRYRIVRLAP